MSRTIVEAVKDCPSVGPTPEAAWRESVTWKVPLPRSLPRAAGHRLQTRKQSVMQRVPAGSGEQHIIHLEKLNPCVCVLL